MASAAPVISTADRLYFTVFLAVAVHAILILGIGFDFYLSRNETPVIEVTLASIPSEQAPEEADYLAQVDQQGGGDLDEKALPSITETSEFIEQQPQETAADTPQTQPETAAASQTAQVVTLADSAEQAPAETQVETPDESLAKINQELSLLERSLELASLDAKLDLENQFDTKYSRIKKINAASTLSASDAYYTKQWLDKIQRIGKQNYPALAKRKKIFGSLRLTVTLLPDGQVEDIRLLRSSGHKILDDAAIRIVRLAEPFAPFPDGMKRDYDRLEITRTWLFSPDGQVPVLRGG